MGTIWGNIYCSSNRRQARRCISSPKLLVSQVSAWQWQKQLPQSLNTLPRTRNKKGLNNTCVLLLKLVAISKRRTNAKGGSKIALARNRIDGSRMRLRPYILHANLERIATCARRSSNKGCHLFNGLTVEITYRWQTQLRAKIACYRRRTIVEIVGKQ